MRRRDFVKGIVGSTVFRPLAARAQQTTKLPAIGFMGPATSSINAQWVNAFVERLRAHDWTEGRTVSIEYRWAEGSYERAAEIAAEFVRMKVDIIVTSSTLMCLQQRKRRRKSRLSSRQPAIR
jgi:putative ABC transport system substrate-binding protein